MQVWHMVSVVHKLCRHTGGQSDDQAFKSHDCVLYSHVNDVHDSSNPPPAVTLRIRLTRLMGGPADRGSMQAMSANRHGQPPWPTAQIRCMPWRRAVAGRRTGPWPARIGAHHHASQGRLYTASRPCKYSTGPMQMMTSAQCTRPWTVLTTLSIVMSDQNPSDSRHYTPLGSVIRKIAFVQPLPQGPILPKVPPAPAPPG